MAASSTSWKPGETANPTPGAPADAFSLRYQLRRRFERGFDPATGESDLSTVALDQFVQAMKDGNKELLDVARKVLEELDGPQRQGHDVAFTYSIVEIVGEDVVEEPIG